MKALPAVFISYNPHSDIEQTLAIRLHTIGAVHGFDMLLPDRYYHANTVSTETRSRILLADFFILFSTESLSAVVEEEIIIAFSKLHDKSKIVVIYDQHIGKNLRGADNCTEIYIDTQDDPLKLVTQITKKIQAAQTKNTDTGFLSSLGGILLVGLGLFALNHFIVNEPRDAYYVREPQEKYEKKKKKVAKKKTTKKQPAKKRR